MRYVEQEMQNYKFFENDGVNEEIFLKFTQKRVFQRAHFCHACLEAIIVFTGNQNWRQLIFFQTIKFLMIGIDSFV